jgi:hypothetical protein
MFRMTFWRLTISLRIFNTNLAANLGALLVLFHFLSLFRNPCRLMYTPWTSSIAIHSVLLKFYYTTKQSIEYGVHALLLTYTDCLEEASTQQAYND